MMDLSEQFLRFLVAGGIAAAVDFLGYNGFLRYVRNDWRVQASMVSVTFGMLVSFGLNRNWAFADANDGGWPVVEFVVVTLVAAYGIQSVVIYGLSRWSGTWKAGRGTGGVGRRVWGVGRGDWGGVLGPAGMSVEMRDLVERNVVKAAAVGAALIWNFSWYRWYVFV